MNLDLEKFYWQKIVGQMTHEDRSHGFMLVEDVIVVSFDAVYLRECSLRGLDQLLYQVSKHGKGRRFLFLSEDGAILKYSGAIAFIENIIQCFQLNENPKIMTKFNLELKKLSIKNAEKMSLITKNWSEVHPDLNGYQTLADKILQHLN